MVFSRYSSHMIWIYHLRMYIWVLYLDLDLIDVTWFWRSWRPWLSHGLGLNGGGLHGLQSATESADEFTRGGRRRFPWRKVKCRLEDASDLVQQLGGGLKYFSCSSLFGEDILFDSYFSNGLKPPARQWFEAMQFVGVLLVGAIHSSNLLAAPG